MTVIRTPHAWLHPLPGDPSAWRIVQDAPEPADESLGQAHFRESSIEWTITDAALADEVAEALIEYAFASTDASSVRLPDGAEVTRDAWLQHNPEVKADLQARLKAAMRARDRGAMSALRLALSAIANEEAIPVADSGAPAASEHVAGAFLGVGAAEADRLFLSHARMIAIVAEVARDLEGQGAASLDFSG